MNNITKYHEDLKTMLKTKGYNGLKIIFINFIMTR